MTSFNRLPAHRRLSLFVRSAAACAALLIVASGCGRQQADTSAPGPPGQPSPGAQGDFKIALITSGPVSDNGWNAGAFKAFKAVQGALKLPDSAVSKVENAADAGAREQNMRAYGNKGYNVVFCHGAEYEKSALALESRYPKTLFVISSGRKAGHNTTPIVIKLEDGAYLEGMLAAGMNRSGKLGSVGAEKSVPVESVFGAFEAGARSVKPNIDVIAPVYTGSWDDAGAARQATLALIDRGADVIMQDVDAAARGVFTAVQDNAAKGIYALGTNSDQNAAAPNVVLASAPIYIDRAFIAIAQSARAGTFKPGDTPFGMKEGVVDFVFNPALASKIPADLKGKIEAARKSILDGKFSASTAGAAK